MSLGDQQGTGTTTDGPNEFLDEQAEPAEWATALVVELNFGRHKRPSLGQVRQLAAAVQAAHERHSLSETEVKRHCRLTIEAATKSAVPYLLRGLQPDLLPAPTPRSHKPDLGSNRTTGPSPSRADEQDGARITLVDLSDPAAKVASALAEVLVSVRGLAASRAQTLADEAIRSRVEADQPITRETFVQAAIAACHQRPGKDSAHLRGRIERTAKFVVTS
ncbi:hypothetical protein [Actinokineospora terrae]|uniref:hypothetical protein n=1 Tax=Actinokineospora terrae TaxID=155974 RepID=UPI001FECD9FE|nr:hypothetical protein [Actinokineospora terrae]